MKYIFIVLLVVLSGCSADINQHIITKATNLCKNNGGLSSINKDIYVSFSSVKCVNGATFNDVGKNTYKDFE